LLSEFVSHFFQEDMTDNIVVLSTCPDEPEAARLARLLVEEKLAACVSVVPGVHSFYRWKGAVESAGECLLVIKSSRALFGEKAHSYEVPEVLALAVVDGSRNYLNWLESSIRGGSGAGE
jgi:periplasmic divalent cation tolerance protein